MIFDQKGRPIKMRGFVIKAVAMIVFKFLRKQWQSKKRKKNNVNYKWRHILSLVNIDVLKIFGNVSLMETGAMLSKYTEISHPM